MAIWSPVTIFTSMPSSRADWTVARESARGGSASGSTPTSVQRSGPSVRATASDRDPAEANPSTVCIACSAAGVRSSSGSSNPRITCGAPLDTRAVAPPARRTVASDRLLTGSNGLKDSTAQSGPGPSSVGGRQHRSVDDVAGPRARRDGGPAQDVVRIPPGAGTASPARSRFWVSVPVLSVHSTSTPPSSSTAARWLTTASCLASCAAPTAMVTDSTAGNATGIDATVTTSANSSSSVTGFPRSNPTARITPTSTSARTIKYRAMRSTARWKWLTVPASCTSCAVRAK